MDLDAVEDRIRAVVFKRRIRVKEFFRDFDLLGLGFVTKPQFRRGLSNCLVDLSDEEFEHLAAAYYHEEREKVAYNPFCLSIDKVFSLTGSGFGRAEAPRELVTPTRKNLGMDEEKVEDLLDRLRDRVIKRRISMTPVFHDFDKANKGVYSTQRITKQRFQRALSTLGFVVGLAEYELLFEKYATESGEVNYKLFLEDVEVFVDEPVF